MDFRNFLETLFKYKNLYILEEIGNRKVIDRMSRRNGKVTKAKILLFDSEVIWYQTMKYINSTFKVLN